MLPRRDRLHITSLILPWVEAPRPIVVRVDEVGRVEAVTYKAMEAQADPLDPTTKYFLNRFIYDFYSRRRATVAQNWARSLRFLSTQLANASFRADSQNVALLAAGVARGELQVARALLHDSTAARVGALFQLLVQDTTAQDFGLPSSAIRLRM